MQKYHLLTNSALMALCLIVASPAYASEVSPMTALPTSSAPAKQQWRVMNPTTFKVSNAAVLEQYDRVASLDNRLTAEKRDRLISLLTASQGVEVMVPDGIVLDYLTGRSANQPKVYFGMEKSLGRLDRALYFDLGDGVVIYWFTGVKGQSCNNIGVVITPPAIVAFQAPPPAPLPKKPPTWRIQPGTSWQINTPNYTFLPGNVIVCCPGCPPVNIPGMLMHQQGTFNITTPTRMSVEDGN